MSDLMVKVDPKCVPDGWEAYENGVLSLGEFRADMSDGKAMPYEWPHRYASGCVYLKIRKKQPVTKLVPFTRDEAIPHIGRRVKDIRNGGVFEISGADNDFLNVGAYLYRYQYALTRFVFVDDNQPVGRIVTEDQ